MSAMPYDLLPVLPVLSTALQSVPVLQSERSLLYRNPPVLSPQVLAPEWSPSVQELPVLWSAPVLQSLPVLPPGSEWLPVYRSLPASALLPVSEILHEP